MNQKLPFSNKKWSQRRTFYEYSFGCRCKHVEFLIGFTLFKLFLLKSNRQSNLMNCVSISTTIDPKLKLQYRLLIFLTHFLQTSALSYIFICAYSSSKTNTTLEHTLSVYKFTTQQLTVKMFNITSPIGNKRPISRWWTKNRLPISGLDHHKQNWRWK